MRVYLDGSFRCHVSPGEGLRAIETDAFEGKCTEYIEGCRFVPQGEAWTREDGTVFMGEMICPWRDYEMLAAFQAIRNGATKELAALIEEIYQKDLEMMTE